MSDYDKIHSLKTGASATTTAQAYHLLVCTHQNRSATDLRALIFLLQDQR